MPSLASQNRDSQVGAMAMRHAAIASVCGEKRTHVRRADYAKATQEYARMAYAHRIGDQVHRAVFGVLQWCTAWFRPSK